MFESPYSVVAAAIVPAIPLLWLGTKSLNDTIYDKTTCMFDIWELGKPTESKYRGRAVVCGGSLAGLVTARMLADHFDEVVVLEPEANDPQGTRKGHYVMQFNQMHGFGPLSLEVWKRLWPDIVEEIYKVDGRAALLDLNLHYDYPTKRVFNVPHASALSRQQAEALLRRMVRRSKQIRFITGSVTGISPKESPALTLKSVNYVETNTTEELELEAALVIDATGQYCRGAKWLKDIGYEAPQREFYDPRGGYVSSYVKLTPEIINEVPWPRPYDKMTWIQTCPCEPDFSTKGVYLCRYDGDRMGILSITFNDTEELPRTPDEVYDWVRACKMDPWVYKFVDILQERHAEIEMHRTKLGQFYRLRYDKLKEPPTNFVPIGDSSMKLNPAYGQGGTKIATEVATLDAILRAGRTQAKPYYDLPESLSSQFYKRLSLRARLMLDVGKAIDYRWCGTERTVGDGPNHGAFLFYWWRQVGTAAMCATSASEAFHKVASGYAPPTAMLGWGVLWPLLLYKLGIIAPSADRG